MSDPDPPDRLANSFRNLSLKTSKLSPSPRPTLSRRASLDIRAAASASAPSTPTLRKRASIASLSSTSTMDATPRRRSSVLSLRDAASPPPPAEKEKEKPLPPMQDPYAETAVFLHDSSYKHRYSRPKTSAAELASIVERPERIPAAVLGVCCAQVRAGKERLSINKSIRLGKLSDPEVMLVHSHTPLERGKKSWPEELAGMCGSAGDKIKRGMLEVPAGYHQGDLYLCGESLEDLEGCIGAVYDGVDAVFGDGPVKKAFVCIRPPGHHCAEREPSGFCWLNNVHIAIAHAAKDHGLTHAVILDFDLHHGDGSQAIAWSINELAASGSTAAKKTQGLHVPTIGYFSLHDINSYPCEYGDRSKIQAASINLDGAHGQHIHNVHLRPYSSQAQFWDLYESRYRSLFTAARHFLASSAAKRGKKEFSAGIFLSAGFDASEHESPGMQRHDVNVPTDFFAQFTADAVALASEFCDGRVLSVLEGGYSDRAITSGVFAHISGLSCSPPEEAAFVPPSISMSPSEGIERRVAWDAAWWAIDRLEEIEKLLNKPAAPIRERKQTSFMDPTAASAARIADVVPRRVSSSFHSLSPSPAPPPPKPWQELAVELSQCFIPVYEESKPIPAAENGKKKPSSARHSMPAGSTAMTLRDRKPKPQPQPQPEEKPKRTSVAPASRAPSRAPSRAGTPALPKGPPVSVASTGATVAGPRQPIRKPSTTVLNPKKTTQTATPPPPPPSQQQQQRKVSAPLNTGTNHTPPPPQSRKVSAPLPKTNTKTPSPPPRKVSAGAGGVSPKSTTVKARVGAGTPPSSPPVIEVNGVEVENGLGRFHGVVVGANPHPGVFAGGEIRFAEGR